MRAVPNSARRTAPGKRVRTPTRLQMEASECGAAALAIVLEHLGSYVPLAQLRHLCGVSRDGSNAGSLIRAARAHGCEARGYRREPQSLAKLAMPVIIHWEFNHFVVLEGFDGQRVYINDPACGPRTLTSEEFDQSFTGIVLTIEPTEQFRPLRRRPALLPSLRARLTGATGALTLVVLSGIGLVLPGVMIPTFAKVFVDDILIDGKEEWLLGLFGGMVLTAMLRAALTGLQRTYLVKLVIKLGVGMASGFLWRALHLPVSFFHARSPGDLASRVQLNDSVASTLTGELSRGVLDLLLVVFYAVMMLCYEPGLTWIALATAVAHVALLRLGNRVRGDLNLRVAQESGKISGIAASGLQMVETLKATGSESDFFARWAGAQAKLLDVQQRLMKQDQWLLSGIDALSRANALLVLGFGAIYVMDGRLTIGGLVAFQSLMVSFSAPIESLSKFGASLQQLRSHLERLDDVRDDGHAAQQAERSDSSASHVRLTGALALRGLKFGHTPFAPPILDGIDLELRPGQRVALVGSTGSGKSTVAKLVAGLYAPWSGKLLFDGVPREALSREQLSSGVALVDQDITLFEGTIRDNLTLWDETLPDGDVVQAAKDACIHADIMKLPGGYDARVHEGGFNFSGGQRQRLELARALTRQPALLVLDEATSALDVETERRIDANLRRRGCSCLIVAHRLSTVRDSDEIVVLERGRVVERGSHGQLLAQAGAYAALIAAE